MLSKKMPWELDAREIEFFHRAVETDDNAGGIENVARSVFDGGLDLWVWSDDPCVIVVVTETCVHLDGMSELLIRMMAGENAIACFRDATNDFSEMAREIGCSRMVAYVKPNILELFSGFDGIDLQGDGVEVLYSVISKEV